MLVGCFNVIHVHLAHIHVLEDTQLYHDFHDEPNFLHPLPPQDQPHPQYSHPRELSRSPTDRSTHRWPLASGCVHLCPHFDAIIFRLINNVPLVDARNQAKLRWSHAIRYYRH